MESFGRGPEKGFLSTALIR
jgi:hypothetical protein